jgi:hypothetical protein
MINLYFNLMEAHNLSLIEDLEDIIKILIHMLESNNISKDNIKLELRKYHYCFDCINHYRSCKCGEDITDSEDNDNYTSSNYSDSDSNSDSDSENDDN